MIEIFDLDEDREFVAGQDFDQIVVADEITIGLAAELDLELFYAAEIGDSFAVVEFGALSGEFANDYVEAQFGSRIYGLDISYLANEIQVSVSSISAVPEPSSLVILLCLGVTPIVQRRRQK